MTALSAGKSREIRNTDGAKILEINVETSEVCYQGGLVSLDSTTGRAQAAQAATGQSGTVAGLAEATVSGIAAGGDGYRVRVISGIEAKFTSESALTTARLGCNVYVKDDDIITTATNAGTAAVRVVVGTLVEKVSTLVWWVAVGSVSNSDV